MFLFRSFLHYLRLVYVPLIFFYSGHYIDVTMTAMACQITSLTVVYSSVYSGADQRKHQSSASLAFVRRIHRWPVNSPHKGPVTRKMFPFDDVIMKYLFYTKYYALPYSIDVALTLSYYVIFQYCKDIIPWCEFESNNSKGLQSNCSFLPKCIKHETNLAHVYLPLVKMVVT